MMMAQSFPGQPGMGHPGLPPGHPGMAQHHGGPPMGAQNPALGMVQGMHPGVSGPQVSQGGPMVTGMPPGAGTPGPGPVPNAHAMSHLGPGQPQMFQQQHPGMNFANPHVLQQHQQQQLAHRRMQLAAMQAAQSQQAQPHGGVPVTMANGQTLSPAQIQAMQQQARGMQNPAMMNFHMQQLQGHPSHPAHMNPQHPQNMHPQAQHMMSSQQNQPNQGGMQPEQRNPNQMMRMPAAQNHTTQPPQPQPTPAPQVSQPPPQVSQPPQSQPTPPQQPPQPQTPQQPPQQPQQPQQSQQPQQQAGSQGTQPRDQQRSQEQLKQQSAALMLQQQQQQQQQQRARDTWRGNQILRLMSFFDHLGKTQEKDSKDIIYWQKFVNTFFSPEGSLRQQLWVSRDGSDKSYKIAFPVLPRYYLTHYVSGIRKISMHMEGHRQTELSSGGHMIHSDRCNVTYWFKDDTHLLTYGNLKATLDSNGSIEFLDIGTQRHVEYLPRGLLQTFIESPEIKHNTEVNKKKRPPQKSLAPSSIHFSLPSSQVNEYGVTPEVMQFLELAETTTMMGTLFQYSNEHPHLTPYQALQKVIEQNNDMSIPPGQMSNLAMQQGNLNPGNIPAGQRTPGLHGPNQFASPGMAHLGLPAAGGSPHIGGSVHTPSPAQTHMAGPVAMVHQQSQQGSNMSGSQGTSANTSPATNKRRRASAVKAEVDEASGDINGINASKVKASPRVGKRQKGAP